MAKHIYLSIISLALAATLSSCYDDPLYRDDASSGSMAFNVSVAQSGWGHTRSGAAMRHSQSIVKMENARGDSLFLHPVVSDYSDSPVMETRSSIVSSRDEMYDKFYVSAYQYDDNWDESHAKSAPNYFESELAQSNGSTYSMSPVRYWPESGKMRFVAHAPVGDAAFSFYGVDDSGRGPRVHIEIPDKVENQKDLLVSYSEEIDCKGRSTSANLNFKHALTGIRFVCDKKMPKGVITNITISGVRHEGDFFYNLGAASQSSSSDLSLDANFNQWELYDKTFSLNLNYKITGEDNAVVTTGENTFVMLPQSLPEGATVAITFQSVDANGNPTGNPETISGSLAGREWPAGKIVTYKISTSNQMLDVTEPAIFNYLGHIYNTADGSVSSLNPVSVASYAKGKNMKWKVQYQDEGSSSWGDNSSWLSIDPSWSWTDTEEQSVPFVAKSSYNAIDIDANLRAASQKGTTASPYNLSNASGNSGVENTANCYMIDAPGYYIFPLVYGNGIENSAVNSSAYIYAGAADANTLAKFENHLGNPITSPYIADNAGCVPNHAAIVWQDSQNLVQNVSFVPSAFGGKGGIRFYVSPATIAQGNAVISISDKSNVMWSWHIWATTFKGFDSSVDLTNADSQQFTVMPVNLGWCSNGEAVRYYPRRECKVRFTPTEGDTSLSCEITVVQESHTSIPFGNNPYYQWGRKDPFVGTNIAWGNKPRWDGSGKYYGSGSENNPERLFADLVEDTSSDRLTTKQSLGLMIRNPEKWHNPPAKKGGTSYVSLNEIYTNLWGDIAPSSQKTVYDPSPAGYQVNYYYTYTGFLDPGYDWTSDKGIEFVKDKADDWDDSNLAEFYTDSSKLHTITFPVSGYRDWNDKAEVVDFKVRGFIWMRGAYSNLETYMFRFAHHASGVANVAPVTMFYACDGLPLRSTRK